VNIVGWHVLPERGPWGGGQPAAWEWPASAVEARPDDLADWDTVLGAVADDRTRVVAAMTGRR
jgi:hypothetical protein